jgi:salicylate 5-hydroxylase large subunit
MSVIWPNVILQQQSNTLATRQIVPRGPGEFDLHWTFFGYAGEPKELRRRRVMQANLMGPGGYISMEDGEIIERQQTGFEKHAGAAAVVELGDDLGNTDHMVSEGLIRAMYGPYRTAMGL